MKHDAIVGQGWVSKQTNKYLDSGKRDSQTDGRFFCDSIPIHERVELPEHMIPADSRVEIDAKINAGMWRAIENAFCLSVSDLALTWLALLHRLFHDWSPDDWGGVEVGTRPHLGRVRRTTPTAELSNCSAAMFSVGWQLWLVGFTAVVCWQGQQHRPLSSHLLWFARPTCVGNQLIQTYGSVKGYGHEPRAAESLLQRNQELPLPPFSQCRCCPVPRCWLFKRGGQESSVNDGRDAHDLPRLSPRTEHTIRT